MNTQGSLVGLCLVGLLGTVACASKGGEDSTNTRGISSHDTPGSGVPRVGGQSSAQAAASPGATSSTAGTYTSLYFQVAGGDSVCVSLGLPADAEGQVDCKVFEMVLADHCDCTLPGRKPASAAQVSVGRSILGGSANQNDEVCGGPGQPSCDRYCGCELEQMTGSALESCREDLTMAADAAGWCYDDPSSGLGNPELMAPSQGCTAPQDKLLRVQAPSLDATNSSGVPLRQTFMECAKKTVASGASPSSGIGAVGDVCALSEQQRTDFNALDASEVSIDTNSADCETGVCLVDNLAPRGAAPRDPADPSASGGQCSCRCDGPAGAGPFCACPDGFACSPLVHDLGLQSSADVAGSYCVKSAAANP